MDAQQGGRMLLDLVLAHLIDLKGGQVTIELKELDFKGCVVRMEMDAQKETVTLKLVTEEYLKETQPEAHIQL